MDVRRIPDPIPPPEKWIIELNQDEVDALVFYLRVGIVNSPTANPGRTICTEILRNLGCYIFN